MTPAPTPVPRVRQIACSADLAAPSFEADVYPARNIGEIVDGASGEINEARDSAADGLDFWVSRFEFIGCVSNSLNKVTWFGVIFREDTGSCSDDFSSLNDSEFDRRAAEVYADT